MTAEDWQDVEGCPGYQVSSLGRFRVQEKTVMGRSRSGNEFQRVLPEHAVHPTWASDRNAFLIKLGPHSVLRAAHLIVAEAFVDNPLGFTRVYPRNGDRRDLRADNLEYGPHRAHNFSGDEATYVAIHMRLNKTRGAASRFPCKCGRPAAHWAYDGLDPDQKLGSPKKGLTPQWYSVDLYRYDPMCAKCHLAMDGARASAELSEYRQWKHATGLTLADLEASA